MNRIYCFDDARPPFVSEKTLWAELERRRLRRLTVLLAVAGVFAELCLLLAAVLLLPVNAALSFAGIAYVCVAVSGAGAIAAVFSQIHKRRSYL